MRAEVECSTQTLEDALTKEIEHLTKGLKTVLYKNLLIYMMPLLSFFSD